MHCPKYKLKLMIIFNWLFIITFGYIILNVIAFPFDEFAKMNSLLIIIGTILILTCLVALNLGLEKVSDKVLRFIVLLSFILIFLLQLFFMRYFKVIPTWDFGHIVYEATGLSEEFRSLNKYFYLYCPNNLPILLFMTSLFKVFRWIGYTDLLTPLIFLNLLVVILSVWILYLVIKNLYGLKRATLFMILSIFITPFYTYTTIVYTDTLGMIFPILSLYLYVKFYMSPSKNIWLLIVLGIILGLGGLFKTHALIVLIAILIHSFFMNTKGFIKIGTTLIFTVFITFLIYKVLTKPLIPIPSSEVGFPKTHWVMMALKGRGGYDEDDTNMTTYLKDIGFSNKQIELKHLEEIYLRLSNMGIKGFVQHENDKLNFTWSDGTYYAPNKLRREPFDHNVYQNYVFGEKNLPYVYLSQMVHVVLLVLMWIGGLQILNDKINFESVMTISIFGLILFLLIWETRSRYLMIYLPVFVVLASYGFGGFIQMFQKIKR